MVSEIEKYGLRKAWLTLSPDEARAYMADLTAADRAAFEADKECVGYMEGLMKLATSEQPKPKHRLVIIEKAILTKPSEKPAKKAPPPSKSSQRKTNAKGKVAYTYGKAGKMNAHGKPKPKAKGPQKKPSAKVQAQGTPVKAPDPAPQLNVDELAQVLKTTPDALRAYAKNFKTSQAFVSYVSVKLAPFLKKHHIGPDKLRRLYEQLAHG